jgi:hypothetical protein
MEIGNKSNNITQIPVAVQVYPKKPTTSDEIHELSRMNKMGT